MNRIIARVLGIALIIACSILAAPTNGGWHNAGSFGVEYAGPDGIIVEKMPLEIRSVPIHPDDGYADPKNWAPIDRLRYPSYGLLNFGGGYVLHNDDIRFCAEVFFIFDLSTSQERNYTNAPGTETRGYGAALTYLTFEQRGIISPSKYALLDFLDNISPEISGDLKLSEKNQIYLGARISLFQAQAENGWDRFDQSQINQIFSLGEYLPVSVYLRCHNVSLGVYYPVQIKLTDVGREAGIRIYPTLIIKTEFGSSIKSYESY